MMSARVVVKVDCLRCKPSLRLEDQGRSWNCPDCDGRGTVEREVFCRDCRHWTPYVDGDLSIGQCVLPTHVPHWQRDGYTTKAGEFRPPPSVRSTYGDHACKSWEPRE